jgi:hypothetical protein
LDGRREDDAVVSYHGPCGPAVAVSLASPRSGKPATELRPGGSYTTRGDATLVRYDRRADIHQAFLALGCCLVCFRRLQNSF